ncbi:hypothetical protein CEE45_01570 [Candidatus Heimdallarchaeota archaeon B3_Heim]|nr:MAG: hypothetical protein CEE45_01570 [Candidatus Heimdallarchaeota archaeon B3_Heim]
MKISSYSEVILVFAIFGVGFLALVLLWKLKNPHQSILYLPGVPRIFAPRFHYDVSNLTREELESRFRQETGLTGVYADKEKRRRLSRIYIQREREARLGRRTQQFQPNQTSVERMGLPKVDNETMEMSRINITWKQKAAAPRVLHKLSRIQRRKELK